MLARRIIPCLDVRDGRVVKGIRFESLRDLGDPVEQANFYDAQGADEIMFLDITASHERRGLMAHVAESTSEQVFVPFSVGGGLSSVDDIGRILAAGADKVSLNTAAVRNPDLVRQASERFGAQAIVAAVDVRREGARYEVRIEGGRMPTGLEAVAWCARAAELGAGEILLTSMDRDGTEDGYDLEITRAVARAVPVPVIASGGAGKLEHFHEVLTEGGADAALAASVFHDRRMTIAEVKQYLHSRGVPVRC
jgi:cyclase